MGSALNRAALATLLDEGPRALFATVSGAHLYGFESDDSDVDLRGAFVQPLADRCRLSAPAETITVTRIVDGVEVDWVAHDVRKFCRLMTRRNGYVLEQLYSPLEVTGGRLLAELREVGRGCIVRHLYHHYHGFAANERRALDKPAATVKDLLYLYRVYLTGVHALRTGRILAHLPTLLDEHPVDGVGELIDRKRDGGEHEALDHGEWDRHRAVADRLEGALREAFETSGLPDEPTTLPALDEYVVRACLELGA